MIEITFNPEELDLKLSGHAETAEKGHDLVCSATSILFYTLCEGITKLREMLKEDSIIEMGEEGSGHISCKPTDEGRASIEMVYWSILNGFNLLAESYPDAITVN